MTQRSDEPAVPSAAKAASAVHVQILHVPDCPLVDGLRDLLQLCIAQRSTPVIVEEIEGPYPSPTLLISGVDVTGRPLGAGPSCRLDLPSEDQIRAALTKADAPRRAVHLRYRSDRCA